MLASENRFFRKSYLSAKMMSPNSLQFRDGAQNPSDRSDLDEISKWVKISFFAYFETLLKLHYQVQVQVHVQV